MPKGEHPNSRANLKPLSTEEARKRGRAGAKKAAETKRRRRTFRELDLEVTTEDELKEMLTALKRRAKQGNIKAFEVYRDTIGEDPKRDSGGNAEAIERLDEILGGLRNVATNQEAE